MPVAETVAEIKAVKALIVVALLSYAGVKRMKKRKKRIGEIKEQFGQSGVLPDSKFYVKDEYIRQLEISRKKKNKEVRKLIGNEQNFSANKLLIEIKPNGLEFSVIFLGGASHKKVMKSGKNEFFIPFEDMKSIKLSSLDPQRYAGIKETYSERNVGLLITLKKNSSSSYLGKRVKINLSLIDDENAFIYLLKSKAGDLFKKKL